MSNLPDDWGSYYRRCGCGARYHASEGGCGDCQPCERCGDVFDDDERGPYNPEICLSCDVVECTECGRELESGKESDEGECPACVSQFRKDALDSIESMIDEMAPFAAQLDQSMQRIRVLNDYYVRTGPSAAAALDYAKRVLARERARS